MVPEADARLLFQQLMVAVDYIHRLGIANRDIKVLPPRPQRACASFVCVSDACSFLSSRKERQELLCIDTAARQAAFAP